MTSAKMQDLVPLVEAEAVKHGIDPKLARAILIAENSDTGEWHPTRDVGVTTTSPKGAYGIGQVMPATQAGLRKQGFLPTDHNGESIQGQVQALVATLKEQERYTGGDPVLAAAMYNGGFAALNVAKSGKFETMNPETSKYLKKVGTAMGSDMTSSSQSGGVRASVSSSVVPTAALDAMQGAGAAYSAALKKVMAAMQGITEQTQADGAVAVAATGDMATAAGQAANAKMMSERARFDQETFVATATGMNINDPDSIIRQQTMAAAVAQADMRDLAPQLKELRNVNFMDDPLAWITSQFKLQGLADSHNDAASRFNNATSVIGANQAIAARALAQQPGRSVDAMMLEAKAAADSAQAEAKLKSFNIQQVVRNAQTAAFSTELRFLDVQFGNAKDTARIMAERLSIQEVNSKSEKEKLEIEQVNVFRRMIGGNAITADQYRTADAKTRTKWLVDATRGSFTIADTPGKSMATLLDYETQDSFKRNMSSQAVVFLDRLHAIGQQTVMKGEADPLLRKVSVEGRYIHGIDKQYNAWRAQIADPVNDPPTSDNPFVMNAAIYASAPALRGNSFAQFALASPNGGADLDDKAMLSFAVAQIASKRMTPEQVTSELNKFYWEGTKFQDQTLRLSLLGFDRRDAKSGKLEYKVSKDIFGLFGKYRYDTADHPGKTVGLFNATSTEHFLTLQAAQSIASSASNRVASDLLALPQQEGKTMFDLPNFGQDANAAARPGGANFQMPSRESFQFGPKITNTVPEGQPSIYAPAAEWEAYRAKQAKGQP